RYWMALKTGLACGLTATRSCGRSTLMYSAVMMVTHEALEAWWPPTLSPSGWGRRWVALWIIHTASQRILRSSARSAASGSGAAGGSAEEGSRRIVMPESYAGLGEKSLRLWSRWGGLREYPSSTEAQTGWFFLSPQPPR